MATEALFIDPRVHDALAMRTAGALPLSLALMDARNRTLAWLSVMDGVSPLGPSTEVDPPSWLAGLAGWFQEYWIARHVQRGRGAAADPAGLRLASVEPQADAWFNPQANDRAARWAEPVAAQRVRSYLAATLEATLELLDKADDSDDALHVFRLALAHEDRLGEALAEAAQALDLPAEHHAQATAQGLWPELPSRGRRDPIGLPGQRVTLGAGVVPGWVPEAERGLVQTAVAEFEIDAQPVGWAELAEFIQDGGYDQRSCWTEPGWAWLQASGRRVPRHVAQAAGGVLVQRQGRLQRVPGGQTALHLSAHEAAAWCQWAGRRLPTEAEWVLAAQRASARGFVWGDGWEWVAGRAQPLGAATATSGLIDVLPAPDARLLLGGSTYGSPRLRHARARRYAGAGDDTPFATFRSCAR